MKFGEREREAGWGWNEIVAGGVVAKNLGGQKSWGAMVFTTIGALYNGMFAVIFIRWWWLLVNKSGAMVFESGFGWEEGSGEMPILFFK